MICVLPKNSHYSTGWSLGGLHTGITEMEHLVKFSEECLTLPGHPDCDGDFNKIFGFSYGYHHRNSVRIGWKAVGDRIRLAAYLYDGGKRLMKGFAWVAPEQFYAVGITVDPETRQAYFYCGSQHQVVLPFGARPAWGYYLQPYYGGDCVAPVSMAIEIRNI